MAASMPYSHSPRLSQNSLRRAYALDPATPVHSPHHSVHSSTSSRTPLHTLSIHEYRKQQNTPTASSYSGTPAGKTLRRKPAASALNEVERVPSISRTPLSVSRAPLRPLHFSQSAHQLTAHQRLPPSPPHFSQQQDLPDHLFRSQTAEPRDIDQSPNVTHSLSFRSDSTGKVSNFKSIKRLPKPQPFATGFAQNTPLAFATSARSLSPPRATSFSDLEPQLSSDAQTPSTFSLSRFPQPPHVIDPSLSPPIDENAPPPPRMSTSYTTTAPATPPATPAVIHYRGTSFDLVNPHDSLLFHDIVTPSRDLDSTDYLLLQSPEDSDVMAPKRSLYGDLNAAYSSITKRPEDSPSTSYLNLPLPPRPAAMSPGSSQYSSPTFSLESNLAVSPLTVRKLPPTESRFSLAQLTRNLTRKLVKTPEPASHELRDLPRVATPRLDGQYPRPLNETYPMAPITYDHPVFRSPNPQRSSQQESEFSVEHPRFFTRRVESVPLSSMVPDDSSIQIGRGGDSPHPHTSYARGSMSEGHLLSKPYYEDMASIYPGSSIYSHDGDDEARGYPSSLHSKRMSNPFGPLSLDTTPFPVEYNRDSIYSYAPSKRASRRSSRPLTQNNFRLSKPQGSEKTDTISKFIDRYGNSLPVADSGNLEESEPAEQPQPGMGESSFSQFDFGLQDDDDEMDQSEVSIIPPLQPGRGRKPTITQVAGSPPRTRPPLAPAFEYDEEPRPVPSSEASRMFSGASSYGDTRQLLQLSPTKAVGSSALAPPVSRPMLEPSSSYSQPSDQVRLEPSSSYSQRSGEASPHTPQEALDHAERIFGEAAVTSNDAAIPAMWARRGSGNLLRNRDLDTSTSGNAEDAEEEKGDWETVGSGNRLGRYSIGDSIADYSSTDDSRDSLGFTTGGSLPVLGNQPADLDSSFYHHPSPLPPHRHPFSSSPPGIDTRDNVRTAPHEAPSSPFPSSPPLSSTVPLLHPRNPNPEHFGNFDQTNHVAPWAALQYTLSDKETQELLNSGPNDEILYEGEQGLSDLTSSSSIQQKTPGLVRENTFEKFSVLGPRGNLTGTPQGTGMNEVGSSVADNSSPGAPFSSSPFDRLQRPRSGFPGFYVAPGRTMSVTRIRTSHTPPTQPDHDRSPSEVTLFPGRWNVQPPLEPSPSLDRRRSVKSPTSPGRRASRAAVHGQTKLRDMILAPDNHTVTSSQATHVSNFMSGHCVRPSTSNTDTPLNPVNPVFSEISLKPNLANEHSPHLLCPERALDPKTEEERRRASWILFSLFCLLPPMLILYRWFGDPTLASLTNGRLGHCSDKPKRIALVAGIAVNIGLVSLILLPIIIAHVAGVL
ncbi:hypothetical protein K505DRAFT_346220 [Melanomma pulvis-pyrius CBS 109.77]|uniref:Uncharacterized protein n=1 Tax=Melanomma pulvis-pyrius CBS 109.77 TaxID=1314802 RepID=A0A6A6XR95_9PLEO|nr:hypothetical protein K505DRAFT_346220 [Melanomma pulvis-pyrius CBS 109.77]